MTSSPSPAMKVDRLWVPLLTHYRKSGSLVEVDLERMAAHLSFIRPWVSQLLLAGSTGDGWEMRPEQLLDVLHLAEHKALRGGRFLVGALQPTTDAVIERAQAIEDALQKAQRRTGEYCGLAVCPPVDAGASQADILRHYRRVLDETRGPIAVYQLPQVTHCSIEPDTMRAIAEDPRVTMFKDTSGTDTVAASGFDAVGLVRGAEGAYIEMLQPAGPYDGWLLSTGNAFGPLLRLMLDRLDAGDTERAAALSDTMTRVVAELFAEASKVPFGNPFSNANRAVDHLWAYGSGWREAPPPVTISGRELPADLTAVALEHASGILSLPEKGYLTTPSAAESFQH
jgi:dihydrodipicolinate synthase/N-acetylneuraminate lyase